MCFDGGCSGVCLDWLVAFVICLIVGWFELG